jgi:hypothetical protein
MSKSYIVIAITAATSALFIALPEIKEHLGDGLHFATVVVSVNHILDEIVHSKHSK